MNFNPAFKIIELHWMDLNFKPLYYNYYKPKMRIKIALRRVIKSGTKVNK